MICAQLMYNNFTNDKNDKINIDVLEKLKEKYNNALSFTTAVSSTEVRIVPLHQQFRIIRQKLTLRIIELLIIFRVQRITMWQIITQISMK